MTERPTIIIDTREQTPWAFSDAVTVERSGLRTGDYSVRAPRPKVRARRAKKSRGRVLEAGERLTYLERHPSGRWVERQHPALIVEEVPALLPVALERKSIDDLVGCVVSEDPNDPAGGGSRERFERELVRLSAYTHKAIVVEAPMSVLARKARVLELERQYAAAQGPAKVQLLHLIRQLKSATYVANVRPSAVLNSTLAWQGRYGVSTVWGENPQMAARWAEEFLTMLWNWERLGMMRKLYGVVEGCGDGI